jgi:hypothetical protein
LITNKYIRQFLSIALLAIFALSNTPTKYLHQLFANHTDFSSKPVNDSNSPQISVTGLNCHCESNVVMAPYTFDTGFTTTLLPVVAEYPVSGAYTLILSQSIFFGLRGPPSMA